MTYRNNRTWRPFTMVAVKTPKCVGEREDGSGCSCQVFLPFNNKAPTSRSETQVHGTVCLDVPQKFAHIICDNALRIRLAKWTDMQTYLGLQGSVCALGGRFGSRGDMHHPPPDKPPPDRPPDSHRLTGCFTGCLTFLASRASCHF